MNVVRHPRWQLEPRRTASAIEFVCRKCGKVVATLPYGAGINTSFFPIDKALEKHNPRCPARHSPLATRHCATRRGAA